MKSLYTARNAIFVITALIIVVSVAIVWHMRIVNNLKSELSDNSIKQKIESGLLKEALFTTLSYNELTICDLDVLDEQGIELKLLDVIEKYHYFFWTNSNHCFSCVESALEKCEQFMISHENFRLAILTNSKNSRQVLLLKEKFKKDIPILFYKPKILSDVLNPAFFYLNVDGNVEGFFSPYKELPSLTEEYLKFMFTTREYFFLEKENE